MSERVSHLNERVEEIIWKIKTLDQAELDELRSRLGDEFGLPNQPDELSKREPVIMPASPPGHEWVDVEGETILLTHAEASEWLERESTQTT